MSVLSPYRVVGSHDFSKDSSSSSQQGTELGPLPFNSILDFVSEVYQKEPELLLGNDVLWTFVNFAGEDHTNFQTLVAFLNMLSTLASSQECASKVHELLQEGNAKALVANLNILKKSRFEEEGSNRRKVGIGIGIGRIFEFHSHEMESGITPTVNTPAVVITPQGQEAPLGEQATEDVLTKQVLEQKPPTSQSELPKRKPARPPSDAWKHFIREKDNAICGCPNQSDWNRARVFLKFLKIFYDATLSFSGSLHVTANNFFKQLVDIQKVLNRWRMSDDVVLQKMTANMQVKFNKYWESGMINYLLFVAVFLDPRYKFDYIEFCFSRMYDDKKCKEMMTKLKDIVNKLFEHYMVVYPISVENSGSSTLASNISSAPNVGNQEEEEDWDGQFRLKMKKKKARCKEMSWKGIWRMVLRKLLLHLTF